MYELPHTQEYLSFALRAFVEALAIGVFFWLLLFRLRLIRLLQPIGALPLAAVLIFFVAWSGVQLIDRWQYHFPQRASYYPLSRFAMYQIGRPRTAIHTYAIEAEINGKLHNLNITRVFSAVGLPSLSTRMHTVLHALQSEDQTRRDWGEAQAKALMNSLVGYYQNRKGELPEAIHFVGLRYPVTLDRESLEPARQVLLSIDLL